MRAKDIMTTRVVTVRPDTPVKEIATTLLMQRISAVPVVDAHERLVGIVSEGDLLHRVEIGTAARRRAWWLSLFTRDEELADEFTKSHGRSAADVMTRDVVTVGEETSLAEIAEILETKHIKRVPVVHLGRVIGIVSRANLVQALARVNLQMGLAERQARNLPEPSDEAIRERLNTELGKQDWSHLLTTNIVVNAGIVEFWGIVGSEAEKRASRVIAETIPGVHSVIDRRAVQATVPGYV
jgi:CBS domain-containing protein